MPTFSRAKVRTLLCSELSGKLFVSDAQRIALALWVCAFR